MCVVVVAGIPHTIDPSSVCLSWTRSKGSVKLSTKKATAGSVTDHDKPLDDVSTVVPKKQSNQLNELENSHAAAPCQVGFDTMSNFAANAALFAPSGTPVSSMFAPANIFAGMPPELTARAMTSNANWLMLPSNANSIVPTSNVVMGGQESEEHKVADTGASNACINKVLSCDAGGLASCQTGAVTIGNSGDATTVTQSLNLKTPIMATNQGGTNIATAQQQHVINLSDPMANQNAGIPVLQNPALMAGAMAGPQLRGNLLMHNGQLILINDQPVMPAVQTVIKNETADKPGQCMSTAGVSSATGAVQSPSSVLSSLQCTPTSTPVPSNTVTSVASTPLFTQAVTTSNTLLPAADGVNGGWTTPILPNQQMPLGQPAVLPPGMQPVKFVSSSTPQPPAGAASLVANQCITVNTPQGVVTMNTTPSQPNQLPSALVLPNGQIIPVVTQPNLLFPQQQCLPVNGGLLMAANNPPLVNHNSHLAAMTAVTTVASGSAVDACNQMVAPHQPVMTATPASAVTVTTASIVTPDVMPDVTPALPLAVTLNTPLPFHPQLAAPNMGVPLIAGQQVPAVRAPSMQQLPLGVPVQALVPGKPADQKSSSVVSTTTTAGATSMATSASPAPVTNLPSTVSAIITPEGNIILTLPPSSAGGNPGNITFDQNVFPVLGQHAGKVVPMTTGAMGNKLKKPGQRVLMPKPSHQTVTPPGSHAMNPPLGWNMTNNMHSAATVTTTTNVTASDNSANQDTSVTDLLSVSVTTGGSVATATTTVTPSVTVTADLLAQATESIFSNALTDISPPINGTPSSYYNPANEDNPLHIDTSAADVAPPEDAVGTDNLMQPFTKPAASVAKKLKSRPSKKKSKPKDVCATTDMIVSSNPSQTQSLDAASSHFLQQLATEKMDDDEESDINDFADLIRMPDQEIAVSVAPAGTVSSCRGTDVIAVTTAATVDKKESQQQTGTLLQNNDKHLLEGTAKQEIQPKCVLPQTATTTELSHKTRQDPGIFKLPEVLTTPVTSDTKVKSKKKASKITHKNTVLASEACPMTLLGTEKAAHLSEGAELMHLSMPYLSDMTDRSKPSPPVTYGTSESNTSTCDTVDLTVDPPMQNHSDKSPMQHSSMAVVPCAASIQSAEPVMKVSPKKDTSYEARRSRETDHKKAKSKRSRSRQKSNKEPNVCSLGDTLQQTNNNKLDVFDFDEDLMENSDKCLVLRPTGQDDGTKKSSPVGGDGNGRKRRKSSHSSKKQTQHNQIARTAPLKPEDIIPDTIMFDDSEMELSRVLEQVESYGETLQKVNNLSTSVSPPHATGSLSPRKSRSRKGRSGDSVEAPEIKKRKQDSSSAADNVFSDHYADSETVGAAGVNEKQSITDKQRTVETNNTSSDTGSNLLFGSADLKDPRTPEESASSKPAKTAVTHDMLSSAVSPLPWTTTVGTTSGTDMHCDYSTAMTTDSPTVPSDSIARMSGDLNDTAFAFSSPDAATSLSGLSPTSDAGNVTTTAISSWSSSGEMMSPRGVTEPMACHSHLVPLARQLAPPKLHSGGLYTSQPRDLGSKVTVPSGRIGKSHKSPSVNHSAVDAVSQVVEPHATGTPVNESPLTKGHSDTVATGKPMESVHLTNPFSSLDDSVVPSDDSRISKINEFSNKQQTNPECREQSPSSGSIVQVSGAASVQMAQQEQLPYSAESLLSPSSENTSWSGLKDNTSQSVHSHKSPVSVISQKPSKPEAPKRSQQVHNTPSSFYSHSGFAGNHADFSRASPKHSFALSVSCSQARQPHQEPFTFSPSFGVPASLAGNVRSSSGRDNHTMSPSSSSLLMTTTSPCSSSSTFSFSLSSTSNALAVNSASYGSSLSRLQFYPPLQVAHSADQPDMSLNFHPYDTAANEHANSMTSRHAMCSSSHDKMISPAGIHTSFPQFSGLVDSRTQPGNKGGRSQHYSEPQRLTHPDKEPCMNSSASLMSNSSVRMTTVSQMSVCSSSVSLVSRAGTAIHRSPQLVYEPGPYFGPSGFPAAGPSPLTSPPLHHPGPLLSHQRTGGATNSSANKQRGHYDFPSSSELPFGGLPFVPPSFDPTLHLSGRHTPSSSQKESFSLGASLNPNSVSAGLKSGGANTQGVGDSRKSSALLLPPTRSKPPAMPPSQPGRESHPAVQQHQQPPKPSRSSKSSKKKQQLQQPIKQQQQLLHQQQHHDIDPYVANALFDPSRSMTPYFSIGSLSPPPRNLGSNEGPTYFGTGNFFCNSQRPPSLANSKPLQHKNTGASAVPGTADLSFNALFTPSRHQNGLGINFQPPGFGMNHHAAMHTSAQIMPHANTMAMAPHMANFNLSNIFSDMNNPAPPPDSSLNISPIKFPHHSNTILPLQASMEPNPLHHQAAASSLYTNRSQMPPPGLHHSMSINSLLSHQHHGFDARGIGPAINSSVAPPFGGHAHSFGIPPLNFPMHDH